jgi:hypothetical protein
MNPEKEQHPQPPLGKDGKPLPPPVGKDGKPLPPPPGGPHGKPPLGKDGKPLPPPDQKKRKLSEHNTRRNAGISSLKKPYSLPDIWCGKG